MGLGGYVVLIIVLFACIMFFAAIVGMGGFYSFRSITYEKAGYTHRDGEYVDPLFSLVVYNSLAEKTMTFVGGPEYWYYKKTLLPVEPNKIKKLDEFYNTYYLDRIRLLDSWEIPNLVGNTYKVHDDKLKLEQSLLDLKKKPEPVTSKKMSNMNKKESIDAFDTLDRLEKLVKTGSTVDSISKKAITKALAKTLKSNTKSRRSRRGRDEYI